MRSTRYIAIGLVALLTACSSTAQQAELRLRPGTPAWAQPAITAAIVEPTENIADLCPDDTRFFAATVKLGDAMARKPADPLTQYIWHTLQQSHVPRAFGKNRQALAAVFAGPVAAVEQKLNGRFGWVYFAQPQPEQLKQLNKQLRLIPVDTGAIGPFATYITAAPGERLIVAVGQRWVAFAEVAHVAHLRRALVAVAEHKVARVEPGQPLPGAGPLSQEPTFKAMAAKLPTGAHPHMFVREWQDHDRHAMALVQDGNDTVVHYTAWARNLPDLIDGVDRTDGVDFGPLPADVVTAATVNVMAPTFTASSKKAMNLLVFPKSFEKDVQPRLASPMVAFIGRLPERQIGSAPAVTPPAFGIAVKMKDTGAAEVLDGMVASAYRLVHLGEGNLVRTLFGGIRTVRHAGGAYRVAEFGDAISKKITDPLWSRVVKLPSGAGFDRLVYGRIGDWWVICSQEAFFRQCIAADRDPARRIADSPSLASFGLQERPQLLLSGMMRADELSSMLRMVLAYWKHQEAIAGPKVVQATAKPAAPAKPAIRMIKHDRSLDQPLRWIADRYKTRHNYRVQIWRESDDRVAGELRIVPDNTRIAAGEVPATK